MGCIPSLMAKKSSPLPMAKSSPLPLPLPLPILPDEVIRLILLNLPVKSLLRFKCVCKLWLSWINDSYFVDQHLSNQQKLPRTVLSDSFIPSIYQSIYVASRSSNSNSDGIEDVCHYSRCMCHDNNDNREYRHCYGDVLQSCDGILCLFAPQTIFVCNPSIRVGQYLSYGDSLCHRYDGIGFGRDQITKAFKIVWLFDPLADYEDEDEDPKCNDCYVLTLAENEKMNISWRSVGKPPSYVSEEPTCAFCDPVYADGAIHWLTYERNGNHNFLTMNIISFDLHAENFQAREGPIRRQRLTITEVKLTSLSNSLCLAYKDSKKWMNIWILMNNSYWGRLYSIDLEPVPCRMGTPFAEHKEGLLVVNFYEKGGIIIVLQIYNPNSKMLIDVEECRGGGCLSPYCLR